MLILLEQNQRRGAGEVAHTVHLCTTHSGKTQPQSCAPGAHYPSQAGRAQRKPPEAGKVTGHLMALKLEQGQFGLERINFFMMRMVKHWNR